MSKIFFFTSVSLLLLNEVHHTKETHTRPEQSVYDASDSGSGMKEPQHCEKTSCSSTEKVSGSPMALAVYDENRVPPHYRPQRQFTFLDHAFTIAQTWGTHGVAGVVWDSAVVLCEYLSKHPDIVQGKHVLELGSGTGLVGMVAALAGGEVTLTERAEPLEQLQATVSANLNPDHHHFHVTELDWTHDHSLQPSNFDVILGADIIYIEDTFPDLLRTLLHFMGPRTRALISCKIRYEKDSRFLSMLQKHVHISKVHFDVDRDIHIYSAVKDSVSD